eukprot:433740-Hanusia_phi.AAC.2
MQEHEHRVDEQQKERKRRSEGGGQREEVRGRRSEGGGQRRRRSSRGPEPIGGGVDVSRSLSQQPHDVVEASGGREVQGSVVAGTCQAISIVTSPRDR